MRQATQVQATAPAAGDRQVTAHGEPTSAAPTPAVSRRRAAQVAGSASLVIAAAAIFANSGVLLRLVDAADAVATAQAITDAGGLYRAGVGAFVVVFILDVVVAWAFHVFLRTVNPDISLLAAWVRLAYSAMLGVALLHLLVVVRLVGDPAYADAIGTRQPDVLTLLSVDAFNAGWLIGLTCFGVHLLLVSYLALASHEVPRVLGVLLLLAGLGYLADGFANVLLADAERYAQVLTVLVAVPSVVGELGFAVWLLARGGRNRVATG